MGARVLIWDMSGAKLVLLTAMLCISGLHGLNLQDVDADGAYPGTISYHDAQNRIVRGKEAKAGQINSIVSLRYASCGEKLCKELGKEPSHGCGGVLISKSLVLTAAHCCIDNKDEKGLKKPRKILEAWGGGLHVNELVQKKKILKMVFHRKADVPPYEPPTYDLCMLKVEKFQLDDGSKEENLVEAKLNDKKVKEDTKLVVAGWGKNKEGQNPKKLQILKKKAMSTGNCKNKIREMIGLDHYWYKGTLCTQQKKGTYSCHGDSGGPLYLDKEKKGGKDQPKWNVLAGIVSWGFPDCTHDKRYPAMYVDVYKFRRWIKKTKRRLQKGD